MTKFDKKLFAERLKESVEKSGMTLAEISKKTGIAQHTFQKYFEGETIPRCNNFRRICIVLCVRADYLLAIDA